MKLSVRHMPEVMQSFCRDLAAIFLDRVNEIADDEPPEVARRLRDVGAQVAAEFETGLSGTMGHEQPGEDE